MYDKKQKKWTFADRSANIAYQGDENAQKNEEYARRFDEADKALSNAKSGTDNIDAVYLMETLAKEGYADACLAMGQLFEYGWAVSKSKKQAYVWYEKAAKAGSAAAAEIITQRKKKRTNKIALTVTVAILLVAVSAFCFFFFPDLFKPSDGDQAGFTVILPDGVTYQEPDSIKDHSAVIREISKKYDTESMKSGEERTNRILLIYTGKKLDLSGYNVVAAVGDDEYITLQFETAEDAEHCMEYLKTLEDVEAVQYSYYDPNELDAHVSSSPYTAASYSPVYHSTVSGYDYYTWGAEKMGFDKYVAYLKKILPSDHHLTVGLIDSGVTPVDGIADRLVDGFDYMGMYPDGKHDYYGHGTHTAGTIIDCTQGLNIDVMPITVMAPDESSDDAWIEGLRYALTADIDIVSMSMGRKYTDDNDKVREYYVNKIIDAGIPFVISAGNDSEEVGDYSPARVERCITVSAIDENGDPASFTNYGSGIDVCAPGVQVLSYYPDELKEPGMRDGVDMDYLDGTSMACPHVAALVAMMQLEFHESPDVISFYVKSYCQDMGKNTDYFGSGLPDGSMITE